jgi:hypothetical protein
MKDGGWESEVEAIDGEVLRLLERRSRIVARESCAGDYARAARQVDAGAGGAPRPARARAGALYASQPHPEAHVAAGDLP